MDVTVKREYADLLFGEVIDGNYSGPLRLMLLATTTILGWNKRSEICWCYLVNMTELHIGVLIVIEYPLGVV